MMKRMLLMLVVVAIVLAAIGTYKVRQVQAGLEFRPSGMPRSNQPCVIPRQ